ncbi:hypothetical protein TNCV_1285481 [Trichonephila clavipes]|uniref:Uncharacterized protein n=1 Tax=Trichonephila clavipes TaxID=2585209 RepID=A0A8X6T004_TRICX|nr:hypothetical protein TNCV_1285481 [Trichonephila clavipes]
MRRKNTGHKLKTSVWEEMKTYEANGSLTSNVVEEVVHLGKINLEEDNDDVQELLDSHNQELTVDELLEKHEQE